MSRRGLHPAAILAAVAALGAAVVLQVWRDARYPRAEAARSRTLLVRSPEALKRLTPGLHALAADVYWIRAIQHFGSERLAPHGTQDYSLLYPLLDITTTLDPYFNIAYRFGQIFLSEPYPGGPGRPDLAIALLEKGIAVQPQKWQYYYDVAFVHYWHHRNYTAAAEWFRRAAAQPNAPNWIAPMAATMLVKGQDRASARFLWEQILREDQEWLRRTAERSLLQLDALDAIDAIQAAVTRAGPGTGGYSWAGLVQRGVLRRVPVDPTGTPFELDPATGRVRLSPRSLLYPLPTESEPGPR